MKRNNKKIEIEEVVDNKVPDNIRILFGRFTFYSIIPEFFSKVNKKNPPYLLINRKVLLNSIFNNSM